MNSRVAAPRVTTSPSRIPRWENCDPDSASIRTWAPARRELGVPRHEVRVGMGQRDVADVRAERFGIAQVVLHVALRVDDQGLALASDEVRQLAWTAKLALPQHDPADALFVRDLRRGRVIPVELQRAEGTLRALEALRRR